MRGGMKVLDQALRRADEVKHPVARERDIDMVLSNSFGFGGTNASLIFRRYA